MGLSERHTLLSPAVAGALDVHPETPRRYVKEGKLTSDEPATFHCVTCPFMRPSGSGGVDAAGCV
jgi:hypothetical protein